MREPVDLNKEQRGAALAIIACFAGLAVSLAIIGTLGWRAAQQGALPRLHQTYEAAR